MSEQRSRISSDEKREYYEKLRVEPCLVPIKVGSRVLVATGLLDFGGFGWVRTEGVVEEIADTAYRVRFVELQDKRDTEPWVEWVHQDLITDVLGENTRTK